MRGFTLIELMVALAIAALLLLLGRAVVHHVPAQQRDPVDVGIDRQRAARGHGRGGTTATSASCSTLAGGDSAELGDQSRR